MVRTALAAAVVFGLTAPAPAGKFNAKLSPGDKAPAFEKLEGTDGKTHSLADFKQDVVVLVVTTNHCPVAQAYEDRLVAFAKKYAGDKVALVALNVNAG